MIVPVQSHTDTKVWTKIANTTDTRHSSVRDFPDTGVSSTTLECNGRGMTRKYEVYIDMNKLHTALFHVDMLTSYFSTTSTLVVAVLNNQLTTKFSPRACARRKFCDVSGSVDTGTGTICKPAVRHYLTLDTPVSRFVRHWFTLGTPVSDKS